MKNYEKLLHRLLNDDRLKNFCFDTYFRLAEELIPVIIKEASQKDIIEFIRIYERDFLFSYQTINRSKCFWIIEKLAEEYKNKDKSLYESFFYLWKKYHTQKEISKFSEEFSEWIHKK